jgi:hypothetical protein
VSFARFLKWSFQVAEDGVDNDDIVVVVSNFTLLGALLARFSEK